MLDQYQLVRNATTRHFSRGFHKLSRAKMEYGTSRLSSTSYDSRILSEVKATILGTTSSKSTGPTNIRLSTDLRRKGAAGLQPSRGRQRRADGRFGEKGVPKEDIAATGLRRRTGPAGGLSEPDGVMRDEDDPNNSLMPTSASRGEPTAGSASANFAAAQNGGGSNSGLGSAGHFSEGKAGKDGEKSEGGKPRKAAAKPDALLQFGGLPTTSLRGAQADLRTALDQLLGVVAGSAGLVQLTTRLETLAQAIIDSRAQAAEQLQD